MHFLLALAVAALPIHCQLESGVNKIEATLPGSRKLAIRLTVAPYKPHLKGEVIDDSWWGATPEEPPKVVLRAISMSIGSQKIAFPQSSYAYIADPWSLDVSVEKAKVRLVIRGSDAGAAYIATFTVENGRLVEKKIQSSEFPDAIYETTRYVNKASG